MLFASLAGCAVTPQVLTNDENKTRVTQDLGKLQEGQETVTGPISLYEAMARALKYNLDFRVEMMRKALAQRQLDLAHYDMLPQLVVDLGYDARDNFSGASSRSLITGRQSLEPSTSADRDIFSAQLGLSWNVLDFGVSYFRAHQAADKVLVHEEEKRKVVNRIVQDVRTAYWRAVTNERLKSDMQALAERLETALRQSEQVLKQRLDNPMAALTYQRELMAIQRELQQLQRNLTLSKAQLAALMNLKPDQDFKLVIPERNAWERDLKLPVNEMEQLALESRPELRALSYEKRVNANETKAALLQLLPGLEFGASYNYNNNSFLFENDWLNVGAQVTWNLLNLVRYPATKKELEARKQVLDTERLAMSMAVLTQLHVGLAQYGHARGEYSTARGFQRTQAEIIDKVRAGVKAESVSEQALIREEMNTLVAEVRRDVAYSDLENSYASVYAAMGLDPLPAEVDSQQGVTALAQALQAHWEKR